MNVLKRAEKNAKEMENCLAIGSINAKSLQSLIISGGWLLSNLQPLVEKGISFRIETHYNAEAKCAKTYVYATSSESGSQASDNPEG